MTEIEKPKASVSEDGTEVAIEWPRRLVIDIDADGIGYAVYRNGRWVPGEAQIALPPDALAALSQEEPGRT